jgi:hypothetical protein
VIVLAHRAPPALRWLAHLLRASQGSIRRGDLFDDEMPFEEKAVFRLAMRQRVAPLIHRALADGSVADPVSEGFARACERVYYAALRKNLIALGTGQRVLDALSAMGVEAAPLKGWALLREPSPLHPDPGTRPMDDLDLMVRRCDLPCAEAVLVELGFRRVTPRRAALRGGHELAFHRRVLDTDLFLEIHWAWAGTESLMRGFAIPGDRFLDGLCHRDGGDGLRPTRLGNLLLASVHGARHTFDRWIWLVDLHRLVSTAPLDWNQVLGAARQWRVCGPLYAGLLATRELLRTSIPREVLDALSPGPVRRRLLHRTLAASAREGASPRAAWTAKLLLGDSWWEVARTAAWAVVPGAAWHESRGAAPSAARRLTHPLRVLRVAEGSR